MRLVCLLLSLVASLTCLSCPSPNSGTCLTCPSPPVPLAGLVRRRPRGQGGQVERVELQCQEGFQPLGPAENTCTEGKWDKPSLQCASNTALYKKTMGERAGSNLAVDGRFMPDKQIYFCDTFDGKSFTWAVDLFEPVKVLGVNISTHPNSENGISLEIRVGNSPDYSSNPMCWFVPRLLTGHSGVFTCSETNLEGRFVSITARQARSPVYLCEVEVLSPARFQVSRAQCGQEQSKEKISEPGNKEKISVFGNTCLMLGEQGSKMDFRTASNLCSAQDMVLLHNQTRRDTLAYNFVMKIFMELSKETRQRLYLWLGVRRGTDQRWRWLSNQSLLEPSDTVRRASLLPHEGFNQTNKDIDSNTLLGKEVSWAAWGANEPGEVGDCAVLDSSLRWSWNAIGCQISALVTCQSPPQVCPAPQLPEAAQLEGDHDSSISFPDETRQPWFVSGSSLTIVCDAGYKPVGSPSLVCEAGLWSESSLQCVLHDCGEVGAGVGVMVTYRNNRTSFGAKVSLSCESGWSSGSATSSDLTCSANGWTGQGLQCGRDDCGPPPPHNQSRLVSSEPSLDSYQLEVQSGQLVAVYSCGSAPLATLVCEGGSWRGDPPYCKQVVVPRSGVGGESGGSEVPRSSGDRGRIVNGVVGSTGNNRPETKPSNTVVGKPEDQPKPFRFPQEEKEGGSSGGRGRGTEEWLLWSCHIVSIWILKYRK